MQVEKGSEPDNTYIIRPTEGEDLRSLLQAIAVASFEQSRPVSMGWYQFDAGTVITPEQADRFIQERDGKLALHMDYVEGRQVKTIIEQDDEGNLSFDAWLYEKDRGNPEPMFIRAEEILKGRSRISMPPEIVSTKNQFIGESLDLRVKKYGFKRLPGESDIDFRKRLFPELHKIDRTRAFEFIWGQYAPEWDESRKIEYIATALIVADETTINAYAQEYKEPSPENTN